MDHEVVSRPSYAQLNVSLAEGEQIRAEAGAMVAHDAGIGMETNATGGFLRSLGRSVLGGESFFQNTFTAERSGTVSFAPPLPGDVVHHDLDGTVYVQSGSYLAADPDLDVSTEFGGARTFFGSEGLFLLRVRGTGSCRATGPSRPATSRRTRSSSSTPATSSPSRTAPTSPSAGWAG